MNYLTRVVSAAGADGCATGTVILTLPDSTSSTFCISPGLGKLRWSFDGRCAASQQTHVVPDDGPIHFCRTPQLGLLRVPVVPGQCGDYEISGLIAG